MRLLCLRQSLLTLMTFRIPCWCFPRYSFVGAFPAKEIVATGNKVVVLDHVAGTRTVTQEADPMLVRMEKSV